MVWPASRRAILIVMSNLQAIFGTVVALFLAALLWQQYVRENARRADQGRVLFEPIFKLFKNPDLQREKTAGVWTLTGRYYEHHFQLKTIADTLATRKLPSLWLMVTLPEPQPVSSITNLMMRAAGVSSFSNFDFLPHTLALPDGFPEQATLRSDTPEPNDMTSIMSRHLGLFHHGRAKEFLISPKGLRIVVQIAESDRARYGVFREANFAGAEINAALAIQLMDTLINLRNDIRNHEQA
jgi:hypothetical protein